MVKALVIYEYLITVDEEVTHIWVTKAGAAKRWSSKILFGLTRYLTIFYAVIAAVASFVPAVSACIFCSRYPLMIFRILAVCRAALTHAIHSPTLFDRRNCVIVGRLDETLSISLSILLGGEP